MGGRRARGKKGENDFFALGLILAYVLSKICADPIFCVDDVFHSNCKERVLWGRGGRLEGLTGSSDGQYVFIFGTP